MKRMIIQSIIAMTLVMTFLMAGCSVTMPPAAAAATGETSSAQSTAQPTNSPEADIAEPAVEQTEGISWTTLLDTQITHPTNMTGFFNENYAITVGPSGEIHYSVDGGKTWPESENSSFCRFSLDIVDESLVWAAGAGNHVRVSKDGGKTWTAASDLTMGGGHSNIDFVDDTTGWITTLAKCAVTKDGGATWTELALPEELKSIAATCLRTEQDGYILTHDGLLFTTTDGGASWSKRDLEITKYKVYNTKKSPELDKNNIALADISFSDKENGIIVFAGIEPGVGYKTWCLTTSDGGTTWASELLEKVEDFNPVRVFISGDGKTLTLSTVNNRCLVLQR